MPARTDAEGNQVKGALRIEEVSMEQGQQNQEYRYHYLHQSTIRGSPTWVWTQSSSISGIQQTFIN